ncbi:MAG: hypothetical protein AAFY76_20085, partial [Cyanobacteria bacterium J06649_11]
MTTAVDLNQNVAITTDRNALTSYLVIEQLNRAYQAEDTVKEPGDKRKNVNVKELFDRFITGEEDIPENYDLTLDDAKALQDILQVSSSANQITQVRAEEQQVEAFKEALANL